MKILILAIICMSVIPMIYADTWENNTITVSIDDNQYATQERIDHIEYTINSNKQKDGSFAGWNAALNTINGTSPQFVLVEDNADITITLVDYTSTKLYAGFTTYESNHLGIISGAEITIYDIDSISNHELQMLMRHELGHALGLGHSKDSIDLMYVVIPYYTSYISQANIDDIAELYQK